MEIGERILVGEDLRRALWADDEVILLRLLGRLRHHLRIHAEDRVQVADARAEERLRGDVAIGAGPHAVELLDHVGHHGLRIPPLAVLILRLDAERVEGLLVRAHLARELAHDARVLVGRHADVLERDGQSGGVLGGDAEPLREHDDFARPLDRAGDRFLEERAAGDDGEERGPVGLHSFEDPRRPSPCSFISVVVCLTTAAASRAPATRPAILAPNSTSTRLSSLIGGGHPVRQSLLRHAVSRVGGMAMPAAARSLSNASESSAGVSAACAPPGAL
jgi:hypothetical protein